MAKIEEMGKAELQDYVQNMIQRRRREKENRAFEHKMGQGIGAVASVLAGVGVGAVHAKSPQLLDLGGTGVPTDGVAGLGLLALGFAGVGGKYSDVVFDAGTGMLTAMGTLHAAGVRKLDI